MQTCNVLDKICIFVNFGMDSQEYLYYEYAYGNSEIDLFFMSWLGFWFPLGMWILGMNFGK